MPNLPQVPTIIPEYFDSIDPPMLAEFVIAVPTGFETTSRVGMLTGFSMKVLH
jgi:hypothetical protein